MTKEFPVSRFLSEIEKLKGLIEKDIMRFSIENKTHLEEYSRGYLQGLNVAKTLIEHFENERKK